MTSGAVAIIPARGGSKRVPRKNVRAMHGKPLIAYTIDAALRSGLFARVLVSTDCPEIAGISRQVGAEVPFLRDAGLSDDVTPVSAATADMLRRVDPDVRLFTHVCQLMPNCPLRDAADLRDSHRQFVATGARAQISVVRYGWQNPWWAMRRDGGFALEPLFPAAQKSRSQDLPELFCPTGAVWWGAASVLRSEGTFHVPGRTGWEISWQHGLDIDTQDDWDMAAVLMQQEQARAAG